MRVDKQKRGLNALTALLACKQEDYWNHPQQQATTTLKFHQD
jgi:hypothetical protein